MSIYNQRSFTGGEVAPSLYARVDQAKYQNGARTMRNFEVMRHGGAQNRPGTEYITEIKDSADVARLIPFVYNSDQTYVLEFGDGYIRFFQDGEAVTFSGVSAWTTATDYTAGGFASSGGVNYYCTGDHTSGASTEPGVGADWEDYWYAETGNILEVPTHYASADLAALKFVQSADVMTFTHPDYPINELRRLGATTWTFGPRGVLSSVDQPTGVANSGAAATAHQSVATLSDATQSAFGIAAHGYSVGDVIEVTLKFRVDYRIVTAPHTFNSKRIFTATISATDFGVNSFKVVRVGDTAIWGDANWPVGPTYATFAQTTFTSGYVVKTGTSAADLAKTQYVVTAVDANGIESEPSLVTGTSDIPTSAAAVTVTWTAVDGIQSYNIYKKQGAVFGFVGSATRPLFTDTGITPDTTLTAPFADLTLFADAGGYPSAVGYYQQRALFGASTNNPETVWGSRTGDFLNFSSRSPLQDDDALEFNLAGRQVAEIKHIVDLGKLVIFASTGEYFCNGDSAGIITPTDINVRQHSNYGSADIPPIQVGNNALFVQARGSLVRDLGFDWQTEGYKGNDLTIFSAHLFDGYTIAEWAFQQIPHSIVWVVRNDGVLLGLTYLPEHQIWGWHRHDTEGLFESVCSVPEGDEDAVYVIVNRTINGSTKRYVERFATRQIDEDAPEDWRFLDCYAVYDGRNTGATTMTLTGSGWTYTDPLTLTASASTFAAGDVGNNEYWLTSSDGTVIRCTVTAYTSATVVTVLPHKTVPASLQATATATWTKAKKTITGLSHLDGETVSVYGDGFVVASPNNSGYNAVTVASGSATLDKAYGVVAVGLPYTSDLETLDIDSVQGETLVDKKKNIQEVFVYTEKSRGLWAGGAEPSDDGTDGLYELKKRGAEGYDSAVDLSTGVEQVIIRPEWNSNGRVFLRQVDPLPLAILAVAPKGYIPFKG